MTPSNPTVDMGSIGPQSPQETEHDAQTMSASNIRSSPESCSEHRNELWMGEPKHAISPKHLTEMQRGPRPVCPITLSTASTGEIYHQLVITLRALGSWHGMKRATHRRFHLSTSVERRARGAASSLLRASAPEPEPALESLAWCVRRACKSSAR